MPKDFRKKRFQDKIYMEPREEGALGILQAKKWKRADRWRFVLGVLAGACVTVLERTLIQAFISHVTSCI